MWVGNMKGKDRLTCGRDHMFFFFRLFPSGVATADFPSPVVSIFCILLHHFNLDISFTTSINLLFVVSSFLATPSSASFSQYTHHPSSVGVHTISVLPLVFLSKPSHLCCPSDILIPDLVRSCHS